MSIITHTDQDNRLHVVYDDEQTTPAERYAICFEGRDTVVVAQTGESPASVWQRVLELIADMRAVIRRGAWRGREHYLAFVYAGVQPTEQQKQEHMKDWISACLYQLAEPAHNKDDKARVQALIALAELHGLNQPQTVYVTLPTLEQIDAEIARRKGQ
ncbi:MAG: hypothetical protein C0492_01500 [Verminephrobacter sp.]|nr:hypothetical protein [Verminephrobacter sp.]